MRDGKPETPAEKFGYYWLGPLAFVALVSAPFFIWIWFGH